MRTFIVEDSFFFLVTLFRTRHYIYCVQKVLPLASSHIFYEKTLEGNTLLCLIPHKRRVILGTPFIYLLQLCNVTSNASLPVYCTIAHCNRAFLLLYGRGCCFLGVAFLVRFLGSRHLVDFDTSSKLASFKMGFDVCRGCLSNFHLLRLSSRVITAFSVSESDRFFWQGIGKRSLQCQHAS